MSDQILRCTASKDALDAVLQYTISYSVESDSNVNTFCVDVIAKDMTDPSDLTEAVAKANVEAKKIKDAWILSLPVNTGQTLISEAQAVALE